MFSGLVERIGNPSHLQEEMRMTSVPRGGGGDDEEQADDEQSLEVVVFFGF